MLWIGIGGVVAILIIAGFFLSGGSLGTGPSQEGTDVSALEDAGKTDEGAEGEPVGAGVEGSKVASMKCEDIVPRDFLESELAAALSRYDEEHSVNIEDEPVLGCSFEVGEEGNKRGGSFSVGLGGDADYKGTLDGFKKSLKPDKITETNTVGTQSFEYGPLDIAPAVQAKQLQIHFITSNGYFVTVIVQTFKGEEPTSHARAIAKKVESSLSS